jgi:hypothetical protein
VIDRLVAASLPDGAVAMPMAPQECIDVPCAEAVDSLCHLALERKPPHFAVGNDVEPRCLLERDGLIDGAILYGLELRVTKTPGHPVVARFAQRDWPEQTANNVGMCRKQGTTSLTEVRLFRSGMKRSNLGKCPLTNHEPIVDPLKTAASTDR